MSWSDIGELLFGRLAWSSPVANVILIIIGVALSVLTWAVSHMTSRRQLVLWLLAWLCMIGGTVALIINGLRALGVVK
jgi:hypothetical protein